MERIVLCAPSSFASDHPTPRAKRTEGGVDRLVFVLENTRSVAASEGPCLALSEDGRWRNSCLGIFAVHRASLKDAATSSLHPSQDR
jgi:hypothetical protein